MNNERSLILVTGATGNVGRQVVFQLLRAGARVRALTRNPSSASLPEGVEVVRGDLSVPDTRHAGLNGVDAVFLAWPFFTAEGAAATLDAITKHARLIVYVSALPVRDDIDRKIKPITVWAEIEGLIEQSGLEWTFLRCSGFATNTVRFWAPQIRADGVVRWPFGAAARSLIHELDIAAVAVRALTGDGHAGAKYVLTGPQALTQVEQVRTIGEAIGRPLRYEEISPETARQQMLTGGWPSPLVDSALYYWAKLVTEPEPVTTKVEELTGTPSRTFRQWASDHAGDFRRPSAEEVAMTTKAVADEYVSLFRQGKLGGAAMKRLFSADLVRVEPAEMGGPPVEMRGIEAVEENMRKFMDNNVIHGVEIDGPFVGEGRFAVRFAIDTTFKPTGERTTVTKM